MAHDFTGKVCLITGAASGIGRATALKMASLSATLALSDINQPGLEETTTMCEGSPMTEVFDVGRSAACDAFVDSVMAKFGRLDFVFNCAGVNPTAYALTETTDAYYDKLMDTNLRGTYNMTRAAMPHLQAGAAIVNTSSIMGVTVAANYAIYCATKFAIVGFTKAMAMELGTKQVRVNAVAVSPGPFPGSLSRRAVRTCAGGFVLISGGGVLLAWVYQHADQRGRRRGPGCCC